MIEKTEDKYKFTFIDLFAGIGGFRLAAESLGGRCVFSSEINKFAAETYEYNFGEKPAGDITKIDAKDVPEHDVLFGGFPCQAFSHAGKKLGFEDTRGTLIFEVVRTLRHHLPEMFVLENVLGLLHHDKGRTLKTIISILEESGYEVSYTKQIATDYGVPQKRQRVYIVGAKNGFNSNLNVKGLEVKTQLSDILEPTVDSKYWYSEKRVKGMKSHKARHAAKGNARLGSGSGFGYKIPKLDSFANTLTCGDSGRVVNIIIDKSLDPSPNADSWRSLTPREYARLQGFPDSYHFPVSDSQAYKQAGNAVCVPMTRAVILAALVALNPTSVL